MALSTKQTEALRLLIAGKTAGQAAKATGVRPETVSRWKALPAFRDALAATNDSDLTDHDINVVHAKWRAYDTLVTLLDSDDEGVQLKAAAEIYRTWGTAMPPYRGPDEQPPEDSV
jgi:hypothetical protein